MRSIKLQDNYIEIPLTNDENKTVFIFRFDVTDDGIKRLNEETKRINELALKIKDDTDENKELIKTAVDGTFQAGDFDKLYELNPSLVIISIYYFEACLAVGEELALKRNGNEALDKYLKG